jgi:hypothetical protein
LLAWFCLTDIRYDEKKEREAEWAAKQYELEKIEEYKKKKKSKLDISCGSFH